ncbi:hypothetical protein D3C75_1046580 [compost metagenome]
MIVTGNDGGRVGQDRQLERFPGVNQRSVQGPCGYQMERSRLIFGVQTENGEDFPIAFTNELTEQVGGILGLANSSSGVKNGRGLPDHS